MTVTTGGPPTSRWGEPHWLRRYTLWIFAILVLLLIGRWMVHELAGFLITLLCSLFLGFALEPGVTWLAARGWRRSIATLTLYAAIAVLFGVIALLVGQLLVDQIAALFESVPEGLNQLQDWVRETFNINLTVSAEQLTSLGSLVLSGGALGIATSLLSVIFQLFTVALIGYYLAAEGPTFRRTVCSVLPPARQVEVLRVWELAIEKTTGFLYSRVLLALASTIAHTLFFYAIGVPYALTLGLFVGLVSQFIPTVGTYIAGALPVVVALTESPGQALAVLAFIALYQQFENYLLAPPLSARTMQLHPAVAFAGVIVGATLIGPAGAFLALPIIATVQAFASSYVQRHELVESEMLETAPDDDTVADSEADADAEETETAEE